MKVKSVARYAFKHVPNRVRYHLSRKVRTSRFAKPLRGWPGMHMNPADVAAWYKQNATPVTILLYGDFPAATFKRCKAAIMRTTSSKLVDVVVVDDRGKKSIKAINAQIKSLPGDHDVVLLRADAVVKLGWLKSLQFAAHAFDTQCGVVMGKILNKDNKIVSSGLHHVVDTRNFGKYYRGRPSNYGPANVPQHVLAVDDICVYIKRATLDKVGNFDEVMDVTAAVIDYSIRTWNADSRCLYFPLSKVTIPNTATQNKGNQKQAVNDQKFWIKWNKWFNKRNVQNTKGQTSVIYVMQDTGVGGGPRLIFEHLNRLNKMGFDAKLYTLDSGPDWFKLDVPVKSFKDYESMLHDLKQQEAVKVATWWQTAQVVWLSSVTKGVPVFYVQDVESSYYTDPIIQDTVISFYRKEFHYLTISDYNKDHLREIGVEALNVKCGIDSQTYKKLPNVKRRPGTVIAAGRSNPLKNFAFTLKAWKAMSPQPQLILYGIEPDIVKGLNNAEYHLKPTDAEINKLYNAAEIFVQTSKHEGLCLPILEAMAAGTAVVTTDSHGNRDFSFNNKNCLMVEHDNIPELQSAIQRLLADQKLRAKFVAAGRETVKEYQWSKTMKMLHNHYNKLHSL